MLREKIQNLKKPTIDGFKCPECRGPTKLVFQKGDSLFFKCVRGHRKNGEIYKDVYRIRKENFRG